jgi:hypothetical protein
MIAFAVRFFCDAHGCINSADAHAILNAEGRVVNRVKGDAPGWTFDDLYGRVFCPAHAHVTRPGGRLP